MKKLASLLTDKRLTDLCPPMRIGGQVNAKTLASLTASPLTNFTSPLTLIRYFQL